MWQTASDFFVFLGWIYQNCGVLLDKIFLPARYIYTFLRAFFVSAFSSPSVPAEFSNVVPSSVTSALGAVPYLNTIVYVCVISFLVLALLFILKRFLNT